jgi:hypothetical protein
VVSRHLGVSREGLSLEGRLALTVVKPDGTTRDRREGCNLVTTAGFGALASALVWSGIQDQAASLGVTAPTYLTPFWGAVGDGPGTPSEADTALFSELSRQTVGAGASSPATPSIAAQATWLFYFPPPVTEWTVTEAGAFANGTSTAGSGTLIDHWAFSPAVSVPASDSLLLQLSLLLGP